MKTFWPDGTIRSIVYPDYRAAVFNELGKKIYEGKLTKTGQVSCGRIEAILVWPTGRIHYFYLPPSTNEDYQNLLA